MADLDEHLTSNAAYLAWELRRIRERVRAYLAARDEGAVDALIDLVGRQLDERLEMIEARDGERAGRDGAGSPLHFARVVQRCRLTPFDEDIVAMAAAPHLSANTRQLMLHAQATGVGYLTVGFLSELLHPDREGLTFRAWADADSRLVEQGVLLVQPAADGGRTSRLGDAVRTPHYVAAALKGELSIDEQLARVATLRMPRRTLRDVILPGETQHKVTRFIDSAHGALEPGQSAPGAWTLLLVGRGQLGKTTLAEALAHQREEPLLSVDATRLAGARDVGLLLDLANHNARFFRATLHIDQPEALLGAQPSLRGVLARLIEDYPGLVVLEVADTEAFERHGVGSAHTVIDFAPTDTDTRVRLWRALIPDEVELDDRNAIKGLATDYELTGGQIRNALEWGMRRAMVHGRAPTVTGEDLEVGARAQLRSRLGDLTHASRVQLTLDQVVLPAEQKAQVEELLAACRNRRRLLHDWGFGTRLVTGKGLVALFAGEAGTGKTLTAEVLAHALDRDLHIVSLPKIVSKWVGETEKNIREVFSEARAQNSMLLFDEADALFARRVKVERSQDHFQNMEVNNLLQEIERFEGIVILTTNLEANMDPAFARRILYKIEFPMPEPEQRAAIWQRLIPARAPISDDVDFEALGEALELSGGQIKNAIVRAAYRCLARGDALSHDELFDAGVQEAKSAGKLTRSFRGEELLAR